MDTNDKIAIFLIGVLWAPLILLIYVTISGLLGSGLVIPFEVLTELCLGILGTILTYLAWNSFKKKYGRG